MPKPSWPDGAWTTDPPIYINDEWENYPETPYVKEKRIPKKGNTSISQKNRAKRWREIITIDIETFSKADLKLCGLYRYVNDPSFEIILFSYKYKSSGKVVCIDLLSGEKLPKQLLLDLKDPTVLKRAHNAQFERVAIGRYLQCTLDPAQWQCTLIKCASLGLPRALGHAAVALKLAEEKDTKGKRLINLFCKPRKIPKPPKRKKVDDDYFRERNYPRHLPAEWSEFKRYNIQDVVVEDAIDEALSFFDIPESEQKLWQLDQKINDRGIRVNVGFINSAVELYETYKDDLLIEAMQITGLDNPNSLAQLKKWLSDELEEDITKLDKDVLGSLIKSVEDEDVRRVLHIRQETSKSSISKYSSMQRAVLENEIICGLLQFYGANTGRWCLTGDHEVLTRNGWRRLDEWNGGFIANWSPTEAVSFQNCKSQKFDYWGELYSLEGARCSQLSTPEHTLPILSKSGKWSARTIESLDGKRFEYPFTGVREVSASLQHSELRVLIMTQADAHYTTIGDIRYHFSKNRKIERCKELLRKAGILFTENYFEKDNTTHIIVKSRHVPLYLREFREKTFGYWMLDESADVIFDELEKWDAYRAGPNSIQYSSINKKNADVIQALAHTSGRCATITIKERLDPNWKTAYVVSIWLNPSTTSRHTGKIAKTWYEGEVYCPETQTGYFLVRRNGKVWVTGNSSKLVQVHNLLRNADDFDLDYARKLVKEKNIKVIKLFFDSLSFVLSNCIRTAFIPKKGHKLIASDFKQIESRVLAWVAGEQWKLDAFARGVDIYQVMGSKMFHMPVTEIVGDWRQKSKIGELACGFQGGEAAVARMWPKYLPMPSLSERQEIVASYRQANPRIKQLWYDVQEAALNAVENPGEVFEAAKCKYYVKNDFLFCELPSGRSIVYCRPRIVDGMYGDALECYTIGANYQWQATSLYGGLLVENLVQGIARDVLGEKMLMLDDFGEDICFHVHDENIIDAPAFEIDKRGRLINKIMSAPLEWAPDLPLGAKTDILDYYKKD